MVLVAVMVLGWQRPPAEDILRGVIAHYQKLKSFTAKVIHHGDFMTNIKESTDTLSWSAPRRFEIVSDKESIPKLLCDGKKVTTIIPNLPALGEAFDNEGMTTKSWEGRGGILLSTVLKGPMSIQLLHPEKPVKISFDHGPTIHWHDVNVSEIDEKLSVRGSTLKVTYYLSANYKELVGIEITNGPETAWTQYTDIVENPDLPKTLGNHT
jgi:outer membrane lipoprotein-sorting protein